jgi:acyl-CoA synthetase (NDP forming)
VRPSADPGVGLITAQAGPGLVIADRLSTGGVSLPRLDESTVSRLSDSLPPMTYQLNPVDTGRPGPTFTDVVAAVAADRLVDAVGVYALTEPVIDLPRAASSAERAAGLPVVVGVDGPEADLAAVAESARRSGIPLVIGPSALAHALEAIVHDGRAQARRTFGPVVSDSEISRHDVGSGPSDEISAKEILERLGIATPDRRRCADRTAAHLALDEIGGPVAVKIVDAAVLHKSDAGGVILGVSGHDGIDRAVDRLEGIGATEFLVERMADDGVDLVVGARRDPVFGPIVVLGLGGTAAEVLADVAIRSAPLSRSEAAGMVDDLAARELLRGYRGAPVADVDALADVIVRVGAAVAAGSADEIEINPLRVTEEGIVALDAVIGAAHREESS